MATTFANVPVQGRRYNIVGAYKEVITDVTVADSSEVVSAANLGLNHVASAEADVITGIAGNDIIYVTANIATGGASVTLATFTAAGVAATTDATTVVRVIARGS